MTWKLARSKPGRGRAEMQGSSVPLGRNHVSPSGGPLPSWALRIVLTFPPLTAPLITGINYSLTDIHLSPIRTVIVSHMDVCKNKFIYHLSDKTHGFGWRFIHSGGVSSVNLRTREPRCSRGQSHDCLL